MYQIKRCRECRKMVHVHKKGSRFVLKNKCEHMPDDDFISNKEISMCFR